MGFLAGVLDEMRDRQAATEQRASLENPAVPLSLASFLAWFGAGDPTASGEVINVATAMQVTAVYACVRLIAESCALPIYVEEVQADGSRERTDHDLAWILNNEPNDEMSGPTYWEAYTGNMAAAGNAYAEILRDQMGRIAGFYPLAAGVTRPRRNRAGVLEYVTTAGQAPGRERVIRKEDMLHCPLFSLDGLQGLSPIALARQTIGLAKATEKFGAKFFGNGSIPNGVLSPEVGTAVTDKQKADLKESWERNYGGDNARRVAVMTAPWKWQSIGISPEESQFIGTQQFTRSQIAGLFRVPPAMIGDTTRLSNNNHEQQSLSFVVDTLRPYLSRIEKELTRKLLPKVGPKAYKYEIKFDVSERLRGDFVTTQTGFSLGRQWGWLSANDVRRAQGMNPIGKEGDIYMQPSNMIDAKNADKEPAPAPQPAKQLSSGQDEEGDEGDQDDDRSRNVLGRYASKHGAGFVQAFRAAGGDLEHLRSGLAPVIHSIVDSAAGEHPFTFWQPDRLDKIADEAADGVVRRMRRQAPAVELTEQLCRDEFRRVVRAVHIHTAREGAAIEAERDLAGQEGN